MAGTKQKASKNEIVYGIFSVPDGYFLEQNLCSESRVFNSLQTYLNPQTLIVVAYSRNKQFKYFLNELRKPSSRYGQHKKDVVKALQKMVGMKTEDAA